MICKPAIMIMERVERILGIAVELAVDLRMTANSVVCLICLCLMFSS